MENGVKTQVHYPIPPYTTECYVKTFAGVADGEAKYPNASFIASREVSLPIYSGMSMEDVEAVIEVVNGD